jgi:hypothetical protein
MKPARVAVALAVTLATALGMAPSAQAAGVTTITLKVVGCEGCTITPVWAITGQDPVTFASAEVIDGQVFFAVPTPQTAGMSFNLTPKPNVSIDAEPVIVTQFKGVKPGTSVTRKMAKSAQQATACWAGTTQSAITLTVIVRRVLLPSFPNQAKKVSVPLAWFQPTAETTGGFGPTQKGVIAQQEAWYCPAG